MSWDELLNKQIRYANGISVPYFSRDEVRAAMTAVTAATLAVENRPAANGATSLSQNKPH